MCALIAFDLAHGEKGDLKTTYKTLTDLFQGKHRLKSHQEFPIKYEDLKKYEIFVISQPTSFFSKGEINAIIKFVEGGGGLLVLADAGGDKAHRSNLNELTLNFGVKFNEDKVLDKSIFFGEENIVIIKEIKMHPIFFEGIHEIIYPTGCSLEIITSANVIAWTGKNATPSNKAVIATAKRKFGRVVISGSFSQFRYDSKGGIDQKSNQIILQNIFNWLTGKEQIKEVKPPAIKFEMPEILKKPVIDEKQAELEKIPIDDISLKNQIKSIFEVIISISISDRTISSSNGLKSKSVWSFRYSTASSTDPKLFDTSLNIIVLSTRTSTQLSIKSKSKVPFTTTMTFPPS